MNIVTSEQMRNIDRRAIEQYGIPSIVLMENAAIAVVEAIERHFPEIDRVAIFCGTGQNGGDGFAVARLLENRFIVPEVFVVGDRAAIGGDARTNLIACERMGIRVRPVAAPYAVDQALAEASQADIVVDAIFGTGLNRPATGVQAEVIRGIASLRLPIVAVDIPSGLSGSSANVDEPVVQADLTITFAAPKIAHIFQPASDYCGEVIVADISIPRAALEAENVMLAVMSREEVGALFPPRLPDTHKGTYGHVGLVAGSEGRSGAAILAARGALRAGAGLATVVTDRDTSKIVDTASAESMTFPLDRPADSLPEIAAFLRKMDAVLVGPGLADDEESYAFIRELVKLIELPLVIDATGVNAFAGRIDELNREGHPRIITPHPGELSRLLGRETSEWMRDRIAVAADAAARSRCVVVLKGHKSLVAEPGGRIAVNPTGNPGMATGGMGDVLSGVITAFLGQGFDVFEASRAAVYLHGLAGDLLEEAQGDIGMTAIEVGDLIPMALRKVREAR